MNRLLSAPSPILPFPRCEPLTSHNIRVRMSDSVLGQELAPYQGDGIFAPSCCVSRADMENTVDALCLLLMERRAFERRRVAEGTLATAFGRCLRHRETAPGRPSHG